MYEYMVVRGGYEQTVKFFAATEADARVLAEEWVGPNGTVIGLVGRWAVMN